MARVPISLDVILDFASGRREARVSDLSLGGCFVDSIVAVSAGEELTVSLRISDAEWLALRGVIVYTFPNTGFGVQFLDLGQEETSLLEHAILMHGGNPWRGDIVDR